MATAAPAPASFRPGHAAPLFDSLPRGRVAGRDVTIYKAPPKTGDLGAMMGKAAALFAQSLRANPGQDFYFEIELDKDNKDSINSIVDVTRQMIIDAKLCKTAYIIIKTKKAFEDNIKGLIDQFAQNQLTAKEVTKQEAPEVWKNIEELSNRVVLPPEAPDLSDASHVLGVKGKEDDDDLVPDELEVPKSAVPERRAAGSAAAEDSHSAGTKGKSGAVVEEVDEGEESDSEKQKDEAAPAAASTAAATAGAAAASATAAPGRPQVALNSFAGRAPMTMGRGLAPSRFARAGGGFGALRGVPGFGAAFPGNGVPSYAGMPWSGRGRGRGFGAGRGATSLATQD